MTLSEINEYNQGYRHAIKWLARQHTSDEVSYVAAKLHTKQLDLWERGYYNALADYVKRSATIAH